MSDLGSILFEAATCGFQLNDVATSLNAVDQIFQRLAEGHPFIGTTTTGTSTAYVTETVPNDLASGYPSFILLKVHTGNGANPTIQVNANAAKKLYVQKSSTLGQLLGREMRQGGHYLLKWEAALDSANGGYVVMNPNPAIPTFSPGITLIGGGSLSGVTYDAYNYSIDSDWIDYDVAIRGTLSGSPIAYYIDVSLPVAALTFTPPANTHGYICAIRDGGAAITVNGLHYASGTTLRFFKEAGARFVAGSFSVYAKGRVLRA